MLPATSGAQRAPAAMSAIRQADLERDMYALAGDEMRGREAGTLDEMRASMWLAEQMRKIGVTPHGDAGSWFQWFNMRRTRISTVASSVKSGDRTLALWTDITPASNAAADVAGPTVFIGDGSDTTVDIRGKIVVATLTAPLPASVRSTTNTYEVNYTRAAITPLANRLARRGASAVILVADSIGEIGFDGIAKTQMRGAYDVVGGVPRFVRAPAAGSAAVAPAAPPTPVPVLLAHRAMLSELRAPGHTVDIRLRSESFESPSVNIIGVVQVPILCCVMSTCCSAHTRITMAFATASPAIRSGMEPTTTARPALHCSPSPAHG
jgi:hypothetical protein